MLYVHVFFTIHFDDSEWSPEYANDPRMVAMHAAIFIQWLSARFIPVNPVIQAKSVTETTAEEYEATVDDFRVADRKQHSSMFFGWP